jgi:hypothetical protein
LISSPVEPSQEKEERFVNEAIETSDAAENSVANYPTELGTERVREEGELGEAHALSVELQWGAVEALSKQVCGKRGAKQERSLAEA